MVIECAMGQPVNLCRHAFATMFVGAALEFFRYRAGLFLPSTHEVRSIVIPRNRHARQSAELWGSCSAMRLARRLGWPFLVLVTDSQARGGGRARSLYATPPSPPPPPGF